MSMQNPRQVVNTLELDLAISCAVGLRQKTCDGSVIRVRIQCPTCQQDVIAEHVKGTRAYQILESACRCYVRQAGPEATSPRHAARHLRVIRRPLGVPKR